MNARRALHGVVASMTLTMGLVGTGAFDAVHAGAGTTPRHGIFREAPPEPAVAGGSGKGGDVIIMGAGTTEAAGPPHRPVSSRGGGNTGDVVLIPN